jgi:hypothetical protein
MSTPAAAQRPKIANCTSISTYRDRLDPPKRDLFDTVWRGRLSKIAWPASSAGDDGERRSWL